MRSKFLQSIMHPNPVVVLVLFVCLSVPFHMSVWASDATTQGQESVEPQSEAQSAMQDAMKQAKELRGQLKEIQQQTLAGNETLSTQQENLHTAFREAMEKNLNELDVDVERLQEISRKIKQEDLSQEQSKTLRQEFQTLATGYQQAKNKTLQNKKLQGMNKDFTENLLAAMKDQNPETRSIIQELEILRTEMRASQNKAVN